MARIATSHQPSGAASGGPDAPPPALALHAVSKRFGNVVANDRVSFEVAAGSIHALVGENGAGKTTLMRIVYGLYAPDAGHIELGGQAVTLHSPRDALARGVGMVHQHSLLVHSLSVADNVLLALPGLGPPSRRAALARLRELARTNHLQIDPARRVGELSIGARQRAEILGALYHGARLLILDEPTTVLTPQEAGHLFDILRRLQAGGTTIMLVTHKLAEVMHISDHVTVLRGGRLIATVATSATDERAIVRMMVGRDVPLRIADGAHSGQADRETTAPLLEADALTVRDADGVERVREASFVVRPGEIVALTGVEGNGQAELVEAVVGLRSIAAGTLRLRGHVANRWSVHRRRRAGLAYIPEERMTEGINPTLSVRDNLVVGLHTRSPYARFGLRNLAATQRLARRLVEEHHIVTPSTHQPAATLSGGNAQKVVVAREVSKSPALLIAAQPTQGVDVMSSHLIRSTLLDLRNRGVAVLLLSSDLGEVVDLADRAVVLYNGRVAGILERSRLSEEAIGAYAMGLGPQDAAGSGTSHD